MTTGEWTSHTCRRRVVSYGVGVGVPPYAPMNSVNRRGNGDLESEIMVVALLADLEMQVLGGRMLVIKKAEVDVCGVVAPEPPNAVFKFSLVDTNGNTWNQSTVIGHVHVMATTTHYVSPR